MPAKKKAQPRVQYFAALKDDKSGRALDQIRWCLRHGGVNVRAEDEAGHTAMHIAAAQNKLEILEVLCDHVKTAGTPDDLDVGDEDGRSALMMAAFKGNLMACKVLSKAGASWTLKCDEDCTARDYAVKKGNPALLAMFDGGLAALMKEKVVFVDDAVDEEANAAAEAAKAKKWRMAQLDANKQAERDVAVFEARIKERDHVEATLGTAPKAVWPEVQVVIDTKGRELTIARDCSAVDPALWWCITLNALRIRVESAALAQLPPELKLLSGLTSLIVSQCGLTSLPPQIGELTKLRVLEAVSNKLTALPAELAQCQALEVLALSQNELTCANVLEQLENLTSLNLDRNRLEALPVPGGEHLRTLSAADNQITRLSPDLAKCQQLRELTVTNNKIEELPIELAELQPKMLMVVELSGNPIKDPRIRRFIEDARPSLVKDLLAHVKKHGVKSGGGGDGGGGGGKKGKGKKGKGKARAAEEEDADDGDLSALLAQINGGSDNDE